MTSAAYYVRICLQHESVWHVHDVHCCFICIAQIKRLHTAFPGPNLILLCFHKRHGGTRPYLQYVRVEIQLERSL